jgi:hypothetical protein
MKKMIFELKDALYDLAFKDELMKNRLPILILVIESCRFMMHNEQVVNANHRFMLVVDDMNRLFFSKEGKMFSIMFPFHVNEYPTIRFDLNNLPLDGKMLSDVNRFLESGVLDEEDPIDFFDTIDNLQDENPDFWVVVKHLMTYEIGYIRYDDDPDAFRKASKRGVPKQHPRYHYDINLDSQATFKIGLQRQLTPDAFVDFLNNKKDRDVVK